MSSRNVFRFVSLRAPEYVAPEPEPFEFFAMLVDFLPDAPDSTIPREPVPVPMVTDPDAERRFFASVEAAASDSPEDRRRALEDRADAVRVSRSSFGHSADWRALRAAEMPLRRLIEAHGPTLALSEDARWVQGATAVIARARPSLTTLAEWLSSEDADALRSALWTTLYAISVRGGDGTRQRSAILFWLRLVTALSLAVAAQNAGRTVRFAAIPIGVPNALPPKAPALPEDADDDTDALDAARRQRISEIDAAILALEAAQADLEQVEAGLAPAVSGKVYYGEVSGGRGSGGRGSGGRVTDSPDRSAADTGRAQDRRPDAPEDADGTPNALLEHGALSARTMAALEAEGIRRQGETPDDVDAAIDDTLEALDAERQALTTRSVLTTRGSVLVRRTISLD